MFSIHVELLKKSELFKLPKPKNNYTVYGYFPSESYPRFYSLKFRLWALQTLTNFYNKMTLFIWKTPQTNIFDNLDIFFVFIRSQLFWLFRHPFPFSMIGRKLVKPLSKTDQNTQNLSFKWRHKWRHKCVRIRITHVKSSKLLILIAHQLTFLTHKPDFFPLWLFSSPCNFPTPSQYTVHNHHFHTPSIVVIKFEWLVR